MPSERQRQSGRQRRFGEIADILKLQQAVEAPQFERQQMQQRQEGQDLNAMLQVLGLAQQASEFKNKEQQAAQAFELQKQELEQQGRLGQEQVSAAKNRSLVDALQILSGPNVPPDVRNTAGLAFPEIAQGQQQAQAADLQGRTGKMQPMVQALYSAMGNRPEELRKTLPVLQGSDPEAFANVDWNTLNSSLGLAPINAGPTLPPGVADTTAARIGATVANTPFSEILGAPISQGPIGSITRSPIYNAPSDFLAGAGVNTRGINDFLNSVIGAPSEGLEFYKQKLTKKKK